MICHILPLCVGRVMNSAERPSSSSTPDRGAWITCRHGELWTPARRARRAPSRAWLGRADRRGFRAPREAGDGRPPRRLGDRRSDQSKVPL